MENKHGDTVVGGKGFIAHQDTEKILWIFRKLKEFTGITPTVVMIDGDAATAAALKIENPIYRHLLCIWYIITKNVVKNVSPYLHLDDLKRLQSALWTYALRHDLNSNNGASRYGTSIHVFVLKL